VNPIVRDAIGIAVGEIGVREIGSSNRGKRVQEYQATTTLGGSGWPWCAAFVNWCIAHSITVGLLKEYPWIPTASCDFILDWARRNKILDTSPKAGDVFLLLSKSSRNDAIHTGFVASVAAGKFKTVEGNTNDNGSANGNGVYSLSRTMSERYVFVRWGNLCEEAKEKSWDVAIGAKKIRAVIQNGTAWVGARDWGNSLGLEVGWNQDAQAVTLNGREVSVQPKFMGEHALLPVRALAEFSGLRLDVKPGEITVSR
jgi:hypothetical protein